jgi:hypothetical protein
MAFPPHQSGQHSDGQVEGYQRVVNGKVVNVAAYAKKPSASTQALQRSWQIPGRPRMQAKPGSYSGGRDIPGVAAELHDIPNQKQ